MLKSLKKAFAIYISTALIISSLTPFAFAEGGYKVIYMDESGKEELAAVIPVDTNEYEPGQEVVVLQPTEEEVDIDGLTYQFKGWAKDGTLIEGNTLVMGEEDIVLTSQWMAVPPAPIVLPKLYGTVYEYDYDKDKETGSSAPAIAFTLFLLDDEELPLKTDTEGSFEETIAEGKSKEGEKYRYLIEKNEERLGAEGEITANEESKIYIRKRYIPKSTDYTLPEQDGVENGFVKEAGAYLLAGSDGNKLAKTLDGEAKDSIEVLIDEDGIIEDFYVYKDDLCSKVLSGEKVSFDSSAPSVKDVSVTPANEETFVKEHGIYSKVKAELLVTAEITETGSGLKEVYLIGVKDDKETRYDAVKKDGEDGKYDVQIALPSEETIKDAEIMYLVAVDNFGNVSERKLIAKTEEGSSVTLEQEAPQISYEVSGSPNEEGWYNQEPVVTAKVKDQTSGLSYIKIYQDGVLVKEEAYKDKETGDKTLSVKADASKPTKDGKYIFKIEACDNSGNTVEEEITIKLDTAAPVIRVSGAEEGDYYSKEPSVAVSTEEKYYEEESFRFTAVISKEGRDKDSVITTSGENSLTIPEDEFKEDGKYTIEASAIDAAGNTFEAEPVSFTKDSTPPDVTLAPTKSANHNGWYNFRPTLKAGAQDALSGLATFDLKEGNLSLEENKYKVTTTGLQEITQKSKIEKEKNSGVYAFTATAIDLAGNETTKTVKLKVDLTDPVLSATGMTNGAHYKSVPTLKVSEDEDHFNEPGAFIRYFITKNNKKIIAGKSTPSVSGVSVPSSLFSEDGRYDISLTAEDAAGNEAKELHYEVTKDSVKPVVTISGAENGRFYSSPRKITVSVKEANYKTNSVKTGATKSLDGTTDVGFPWNATGENSSSSKTFSDTGTYTVTASATDKAGNSSGQKSITFTVDAKAPEVTVTGVTDGKIYTYGEGLSPSVSFKDDYLDSKSVVYTKAGETIQNPSFEPLKENDGAYTLTATATDKAGNTTTTIVNFVINRFGSYFEYPDATKGVMGKAMQNLEGDIVINEHNVSKLEKSSLVITRDGKRIDSPVVDTTKKLGDKENLYTHKFANENFADEGAYEVNVVSKDEAGNEMESKAENGPIVFYVDRTAPTLSLSGIDPKGNNADSITVTINTQDLLTGIKDLKAYVNGEEVAIDIPEEGPATFTVGSGMNQEVKVTAADGAGNSAEAIETASVSASAFSLFFNRFKVALAALGAGALALLGLLFALFKRRKKKDEE